MNNEPRKDRRLMIAAGGALALLAGLGIAVALQSRSGPTPKAMDTTQRAGLQVQMGAPTGAAAGDGSLRCFVGGRFAGMTTLDDCARQNGVATDALDVGLDPSGAVAATGGDGLELQPLPQPVTEAPPPMTAPLPVPAPAPAAAPVRAGSACLRFNGSDWRKVGDQTSLDACVQTLFSGRCERPGAASYGRWGEQTLRLVPGKVERAYDNRNFRTLVEQPAGDCRIPTVSE
jgi:hypothetical protein